MATIVLADDHKLVRKGVRALLEGEPDFKVVGEANDGTEAIKLVGELKPDVLVTDRMMGNMSGIEVTRQIHKLNPETAVIILSMYGSYAYVLEAWEVGAVGYVLKESSAEDLVHAIREALAGRRYLSPPLNEKDADVYRRKVKGEKISKGKLPHGELQGEFGIESLH